MSDEERPLRHVGNIHIPINLLNIALQLPAGHTIIGAEWDFANDGLRLYIEGPLMPTVLHGLRSLTIPVCSEDVSDEEEKLSYTWGTDGVRVRVPVHDLWKV